MFLSLNGNWELRYREPESGNESVIPGRVPGNVYGDLVRAGRMPDPCFGTNSGLFRPYEFIDWEYSTRFTAPALSPGERLELVFDGVDTVFDCFVNGIAVGSGRNMFIAHRFDVTGAVRPGAENELSVHIRSSVNAARAYRRPTAVSSSLAYNFEGLPLRRAMHTYGWDIAPRLVGAGLWRGVSLETVSPTRWGECYLFTQEITEEGARVMLDWNFDTEAVSLDGFEAELTMKCAESEAAFRFPLRFTTGRREFTVPNPRLWWPLGSGEQNLYDVTLRLFHDGELRDTRSWRTGIRTVRLERTETNFDGAGKFCFEVNHRKIFIKGSNWVPADALHGEHPERVRKGLELFLELGCNMVRCWGGGVYEDHDFFDFCDENGLLVWQDFMFACEIAPRDAGFAEEVRREAEAVVCKLRQHPSLALWSGDNECDELYFYEPLQRWKTSMNRLSREVLPEAVFANDPIRDYLPSSPYLCDELKQRNARYASPEQHLWGPRDNWKNSFYTGNTAIFASEIGYHGMPAVESLRKFLPPASLDARSARNPDWLCHCAQPFGESDGGYAYRIKLMLEQVEGFFGKIPLTLEELSEASQIVQAEAMKYFVESFRMHKWAKTGLVWWNVIDCWPQFSDAVVDYYYTKKLAFHYIRNVQQPVLLLFSEPEAWCIALRGVNDLDREAAVHYRVTDTGTGKVELEGDTRIAADSARKIASLPICQGIQRILRIDFEYENRRAVNHYLQGCAPIPRALYAEWLAVAREVYQ